MGTAGGYESVSHCITGMCRDCDQCNRGLSGYPEGVQRTLGIEHFSSAEQMDNDYFVLYLTKDDLNALKAWVADSNTKSQSQSAAFQVVRRVIQSLHES